MKFSNYFTIENGILQEYNGGGAVVVPDGVTTIGKNAFGGCRNLTSVILPDSVTRIEAGAFGHCFRMTKIRLPEGLAYIGPSAFAGCEKLTLTTLPGCVTEIGAWAFEGCLRLTLKEIPDHVTTIGDGAFHRCKQMQDANGLVIVRNVLYSYYGKCDRLVIPAHITALGAQSFQRHQTLTEVVLPDGLTTIGDRAFDQCERMTHIVLPDGVTCIGERTFSGCTSLETVHFPAALQRIGYAAFSGCDRLQEVQLPDGLTEIGMEAFAGCAALTKAILPDALMTLGPAAFAFCSALHQLRVPKSVPTPEHPVTDPMHPFYGCNQLMDSEGFLILHHVLYRYGGSESHLIVPPQVTALADSAFAHCSFLENVVLPDGLTYIGENAFADCVRLTSLTLPDTIAFIGPRAFAGCNRLTVSISGALPVPDRTCEEPVPGAFANAYAVISPKLSFSFFAFGDEQRAAIRGFLQALPLYDRNPTRQEYVTCALRQWRKMLPMIYRTDLVPAMAFYAEHGKITVKNFESDFLSPAMERGATGCTAFLLDWRARNLPLPDLETQLEQTSHEEIRVQDWLYHELPDHTLEITGYYGNDTEVVVPARIGRQFVTEIGDHAFNARGEKAAWRQSIRSIQLPDGIVRIGAWAFYCCAGLVKIELPDSLMEIGRRAFEDCTGLTEVCLPDGVNDAGYHLFSGCEQLRRVTVSGGLRTLPGRMFAQCTALTDVVLSAETQIIPGNAFSGCGNLTIHAPADSAAAAFAAEHHMAFRAL